MNLDIGSLRQLTALWDFDLISLEDLTAEVGRMIETGDSQHLMRLLIEDDLRREEVSAVLSAALHEMGSEPASRPEAGRLVAASVAQSIIDGRVTPQHGASILWWKIWDVERELFEELVFIGSLAHEYDEIAPDDVRTRQELDEAVVSAAREYLLSR